MIGELDGSGPMLLAGYYSEGLIVELMAISSKFPILLLMIENRKSFVLVLGGSRRWSARGEVDLDWIGKMEGCPGAGEKYFSIGWL
jgi:hypothetical protein